MGDVYMLGKSLCHATMQLGGLLVKRKIYNSTRGFKLYLCGHSSNIPCHMLNIGPDLISSNKHLH